MDFMKSNGGALIKGILGSVKEEKKTSKKVNPTTTTRIKKYIEEIEYEKIFKANADKKSSYVYLLMLQTFIIGKIHTMIEKSHGKKSAQVADILNEKNTTKFYEMAGDYKTEQLLVAQNGMLEKIISIVNGK